MSLDFDAGILIPRIIVFLVLIIVACFFYQSNNAGDEPVVSESIHFPMKNLIYFLPKVITSED